MKLASIIYKNSIPKPSNSSLSAKLGNKFCGLLRQGILKFTDPLCQLQVHGVTLDIPLSHPLPIIQAAHPQCDSVLGRLADSLRENCQKITYVDIGANIGDTIAAIHPKSGEHVFAVEPFPTYAAILRKNLARFNCTSEVIEKACVEHSGLRSLSIEGNKGTGVLAPNPLGSIISTTLDCLMSETAGFADCNLLKIDVDGHDFSVLRGGREFLERSRPYILMECDVFENKNYVEDYLELIKSLRGSGYNHMLAYDNYGGLIYSSKLEYADQILPILFYQTTRGRIYLDLLFGDDLQRFHQSEMEFYSDLAPNASRREVAIKMSKQLQL
jgi:FkbM family methyltransferase